MYKVGDEVLLRGTIERVEAEDTCNRPYLFKTKCGHLVWTPETEIKLSDKTYEQGLADAWELAKKICHAPCDGGYSMYETREIFGCVTGVMRKFTAAEALAKIEAYEKEKEIKVGDVVKSEISGYSAVVTVINRDEAHVVFDDGSTGVRKINCLTKTGKHIEIEGILKQIGG